VAEQSAANDGAGSCQAGSISSSLLDRIKLRDPEAWRRLVRLYGPVVYGWCRQSGLQPADAADVVQETFRAVAASVGDFHRQRPGDSFRGWLWAIARNKVRDHFRRRRGLPAAQGGSDALQQLLQIPDDPPESSQSIGSAAGSGRLAHSALELVRAAFEDRTWQAFWRTTVDPQPAAAVADELGMTTAAVYKAKSRVLQRIRQELGDLLE
jgi:RNA polymerase sigma-70 factor (ECF subfamily)